VGTLASLAVTGDLTVDTSTLKVDAANNRVGIGTASPAAVFHVANSSSAVIISQDGTVPRIIGTNAAGDASNELSLRGNPLTFTGNGGAGATQMTLDASGNVGIGVTPSAWSSSYKALQIGNMGLMGRSGLDSYIYNNAYFGASSDTYIATGEASYYRQASGIHAWHTAPSGTAGTTVTFTERARITAGGYFKASDAGTYRGATATSHEFNNSVSNNATLVVNATSTAFTNTAFVVFANRNTTDGTFSAIAYYNDAAAAVKFNVADSGNVTNTNNSYGGPSDEKLKQDIVDAASQWDDLKGVRVRKFRYTNDPTGPLHIGVVAQELEAVSPGLIDESPDYENVKVETEVEKSRPVMHEVEEIVTDKEGVESVVMKSVPMLDEDGKEITETYTETETRTERVALGTVTKSVKYSVLYMKAVGALQEAMARIESLEARLDALEN
jgi:hypothetical protein